MLADLKAGLAERSYREDLGPPFWAWEQTMPSNSLSPSWPDWLGIALEPRAYGAVAYQLLSLPLGIAGVVWLTAGLGLSLGLAILGVGILLGFCLLASVRGIALLQGKIVWSLAGQASLDLSIFPDGSGFWDRLRRLLVDPTTWLSQLYVFLRLPLGILGFALLLSTILLSSSCILAAGVHWASHQAGPDGLATIQVFGAPFTFQPDDCEFPPFLLGLGGFGRLSLVAAGIGGLLGSLHLALALTWLEGRLARTLLSRR